MNQKINEYIKIIEDINENNFLSQESISQYKTESILNKFYLKKINYENLYSSNDNYYNIKEYKSYIYNLLLEVKIIENKLNSVRNENNQKENVKIIDKISDIIKEYYSKNNNFKENSLNIYEKIERIIIDEYNNVFINEEKSIDKEILEKSTNLKSVVFFDDSKIQEINYIKENEIIYFKYKTKNDWLYKNNNILEIRKIIEESKINILKMKLKSHSSIFNLIKEKIKYTNYEINEPLRIIDKIIEYKNLLKSKNINIVEFLKKSENFEYIEDEIDLCIKNSKVEKLIKSIISSKYNNLIYEKEIEKKEKYTDLNKETFKLLNSLIEENINNEDLQNFIGKKIARYKTNEDLNEALKSLLRTYSGFSKENILMKIEKEKLNADIVFFENNILVIKINDFKSSKILGSSSWCISNYERTFENYTENKEQYFVYDFNKMPEDNESMVGYTFKNNKIYNSHLKNDNYNNNEKIINEFLNIIKKIELKDKNKKFKIN